MSNKIAKGIIIAFVAGVILIFLIDLAKGEEKVNPCNDSLLLSVQNKSLDKMSRKELEDFIEKAKKCADYKRDSSTTLQPAKKDSLEGQTNKTFDGKK